MIKKQPEPAPTRAPRERKETPAKREFRENRENYRKSPVPVIPTVDPAVAIQETKRDYAGKLIGKQQERDSDKFSKKDGRKESSEKYAEYAERQI